MKAEGPHWQADADIAGSRLGELAGHWTAEAPSPASLPTAGSPLHGNVQGARRGPQRLGRLAAAGLAPGRRAAHRPRAVGPLGRSEAHRRAQRATKLAMRNALEGVYGHDGEAAIRLTGDQAQIERFHLLGGNGSLALAGSASLGAVPVAKLQLQATPVPVAGPHRPQDRHQRQPARCSSAPTRSRSTASWASTKACSTSARATRRRWTATSRCSDATARRPTQPSRRRGRAAVPKTEPRHPDRPRRRPRRPPAAARPRHRHHAQGRAADHLARRPAGGARRDPHRRAASTSPTGRSWTSRAARSRSPASSTTRAWTSSPTRPNLDVVVGVAITGTALAPHVKLMSEPEMSDADKLSWLMLGRAPETVGGADTALLQQAAMALLRRRGRGAQRPGAQAPGPDRLRGRPEDRRGTTRKQTVVTLGPPGLQARLRRLRTQRHRRQPATGS